MRLYALGLALLLSGCVSVVRVCGPDPVVTTHAGLGVSVAPHATAVGIYKTTVTAIPPTCGVAIIQNPQPSALPHWRAIAGQVAAHCLKGEP